MFKILNYSDVEYIVVHASATPASMDIGAKEIDRWHRERDFWMIGYHFVIRRDGSLEAGRPLHQRGAHAHGYNDKSWGICMVGGVDEEQNPENNFSERQFETLQSTVSLLKVLAPSAEVLGHRDLSPDLNGDGIITPNEFMKACPCFDVRDWYGANFQPIT